MSIVFFKTGRIVLALFASTHLVCGTSVLAQEVVRSAKVGTTDATQTVVDVRGIEEYIEQVRRDWGVPGLAVCVVKDDAVVLNRGFGVREVGSTEQVDEHTLFAIASNSKAFTSAALAILVDQGKLQWDDHVSDYLPWLKLRDPLASADLRVRDLLCHRSGLGTFSGDLLWWGTQYSPREVLERAVHLEPAAPFRAKYGYSNLMFLAAGLVIEEVSGTSWEDFVGEHIIARAGMERTVVSVRDLVSLGNYATPHKTFLDRNEPISWMNWDSMAAAGGIISNVDDMSNWIRLQLRRGAMPQVADGEMSSLYSEPQARLMWEAQIPIPVSEGYNKRSPTTHFRAYGLGWALADYEGRKTVGHGGGYDGMYSQVLMVPEENLGIVVLTNSMTSIGSAITNRIVDAYVGAEERDWSEEGLQAFRKSRSAFDEQVTQAITSKAEGTQPSHPLEDYAAEFECPMYGRAVTSVEAGKLVLRLLPNPTLVADLEHLHYDTFVVRWRSSHAWFDSGTAHFVADAAGRFNKLEIDIPNDDLWFYELKFSR